MRALTPGPPAPLAAVASPCSTGGAGGGGEGEPAAVGVGGPGQRLVISGLLVPASRASACTWLPPSPLLGAAPVPALVGGGRSGSGGPCLLGGCPGLLVLSQPPLPAAWDHCCRARPSPAPPLVLGRGLRRQRVPPAVAPVGEGGAQGPGEPVVGLCISEAEHRPPSPVKPATAAPCPATPPESRPGRPFRGPPGPPTPLGASPGSPPFSVGAGHRRAGSSSPLWSPRGPSPANHTPPPPEGGPRPPRGSRIASLSRAQSPRAPSAPRAGSPCGSCACGAGAAPYPLAAGAAAFCAGSALDSCAAGAGPRVRRCAVGGPAGRGVGQVWGGLGPPGWGRCCRGGRGGGCGGRCGAPATIGCRGGHL